MDANIKSERQVAARHLAKNDKHTKKGTAIRLCLFAMRMQLG